jgi:hypothetical protein
MDERWMVMRTEVVRWLANRTRHERDDWVDEAVDEAWEAIEKRNAREPGYLEKKQRHHQIKSTWSTSSLNKWIDHQRSWTREVTSWADVSMIDPDLPVETQLSRAEFERLLDERTFSLLVRFCESYPEASIEDIAANRAEVTGLQLFLTVEFLRRVHSVLGALPVIAVEEAVGYWDAWLSGRGVSARRDRILLQMILAGLPYASVAVRLSSTQAALRQRVSREFGWLGPWLRGPGAQEVARSIRQQSA